MMINKLTFFSFVNLHTVFEFSGSFIFPCLCAASNNLSFRHSQKIHCRQHSQSKACCPNIYRNIYLSILQFLCFNWLKVLRTTYFLPHTHTRSCESCPSPLLSQRLGREVFSPPHPSFPPSHLQIAKCTFLHGWNEVIEKYSWSGLTSFWTIILLLKKLNINLQKININLSAGYMNIIINKFIIIKPSKYFT